MSGPGADAWLRHLAAGDPENVLVGFSVGRIIGAGSVPSIYLAIVSTDPKTQEESTLELIFPIQVAPVLVERIQAQL